MLKSYFSKFIDQEKLHNRKYKDFSSNVFITYNMFDATNIITKKPEQELRRYNLKIMSQSELKTDFTILKTLKSFK